MLDIVEKFEATYAELAPAIETPADRTFSDDLFPEFPDVFDAEPTLDCPASLPPMPSSARGAREPVWAPDTIPAPRPDRHLETEDEIDIDEAFSILRAAEVRRADAEQREAHDSEPPAEAHANAASASVYVDEPATARRPAEPQPVAGLDWAAQSRRPHTIAVAAVVLALMVGIAVGYVAGRSPDQVAGSINASRQGGVTLQLDYDLQKR